jgi:YbbR domain-containing protein
MKMSSIKYAFTHNLGVKLIALVVALFIWFSASGQQQATRFFIVPLKLVGIPDSLTVVGSVPSEAEVTIVGTKRELLYLNFRRIEVVVNLNAAEAGRFRERLSASNVVARGGLDTRNVRIISPTSIDLFFERLIMKRVPVELIVSGSVPSGYVLIEGPRVEPPEIVVRGPASSVARLKSLPTKPFDLSKVKSNFEKNLDVEFDHSLFSCEPSQVTVTVTISQLGQRVLPNIPPTVLFDANQLAVDVIPNAVSLTLNGLRSALDTLSSGDVSVLLDLSGKPPGRYRLVPEIILPKGVGSYSMNVDSLTVVVREDTTRRGK